MTILWITIQLIPLIRTTITTEPKLQNPNLQIKIIHLTIIIAKQKINQTKKREKITTKMITSFKETSPKL